MPLDVRCLQPGLRESDGKVEPADTAPVLVRPQDALPKARVATTTLRVGVDGRERHRLAHFARSIEVQAQAGHDVAVKGQWELGIQHAGNHGLQQARCMAQGVVDLDGDAALDVVRARLAQAGHGASGTLENLARPT